MPQQQRRLRRTPYPRHHFHERTPWLRIFADKPRERALVLRARQHHSERDEDFLDQVEDAEQLFASASLTGPFDCP